jgi:hypothetical protein
MVRRDFLRFCAAVGFLLYPLYVAATEPFPPTVVTCKDGKWTFRCGKSEGLLGGARIIIQDDDRKSKVVLSLTDLLSKDDIEKYVHETTAGPIWDDYALAYFATNEDTPHLCIRTWWDRRIVINLKTGKPGSEKGWSDTLDDVEKKLVLERLKAVPLFLDKKDKTTAREHFEILGAAHFAGRKNLKETTRLLAQLERCEYSGSSVFSGDPRTLKEGEIDPESYSEKEVRRIAQLSLRRLGAKPEAYPVTRFRSAAADGSLADYVEPKKWTTPRTDRASKLKEGMNPLEILNLLGAPDYVERGRDTWHCAWRYDMDASPAYTLLLVWEAGRVKSTERIQPALWRGNELFGKDLKQVVFGSDGQIVWMRAALLYGESFRGTVTRLK